MTSLDRIIRSSDAEIISQKKNRIICLILFGFGALSYGMDDEGLIIAFLLYTASLAVLFSCTVGVFRYFHDIPTADVQMSLPISNRERYLSSLLSVCRIWFIPFLVSAVAGLIMKGFITLGHNSNDLNPFKVLLWFLASALFIFSVTSFCQCCIGTKSESRFIPILVMISMSIFLPAIYTVVIENFGQESNFDPTAVATVWTLSSFFSAFGDDGDALLLIINCLISVAVLVCGVFVSHKRDARSVGKAVVYPVFFEVLIAIIIFLFFMLTTGADSEGRVYIMFIAWLGTIILRLIVSKKKFSIARIGIWTAMYFGYYIIFMLFMYAAFLTGGFGHLYQIPEIDEKAGYIYLDVGVYQSTKTEYNDLLNINDHKIQLTAENRERVTQIMKLCSKYAHKQQQIPNIFNDIMYSSYIDKYDNKCRCYIRIKQDNAYDTYTSNYFYEIKFPLELDDAKEFISELSDLQ